MEGCPTARSAGLWAAKGGLPIGVVAVGAVGVGGSTFLAAWLREEGDQGLGEGAEVAGLDPDGAVFRGSANLFEVHDEAFAAGDEGAEAADLADGVVEVAGEGDEVAGVDGESLALGDT